MEQLWLVNGTVVGRSGDVAGAVGIRGNRIAALRRIAPRGSARVDVHHAYIAPGFIDLHIWGDPRRVAHLEPRSGTTSFLASLGPNSPERLVAQLADMPREREPQGARCLGAHLEGPFLNPRRAGALASRWLRPPTTKELRQLLRHSDGYLKLVTLAPELPGAVAAIRWFAARGVAVSIGHSEADAHVVQRAVAAGARAVTHLYNGMPPFHHRELGLVGAALTEQRLAAMMICDGVHIDPRAARVALCCKGADRIILVTDSLRHGAPRQANATRGAYRTTSGMLAGSRLTMIEAVRNTVEYCQIPIADAVKMASLNPARLLGIDRECGSVEIGKRADLVVFDEHFRVHMTIIDGQIVYRINPPRGRVTRTG